MNTSFRFFLFLVFFIQSASSSHEALPAPPHNPLVESRFDFGLATIRAPMRPEFKAATRQGEATLRNTESVYTAMFARTRWMVPFQAEAFTVSGGFSLALFPGNASLVLAPARGPDGRYLSQYAFHTRIESEWNDFVFATGLSMTMNRMDYVELAIESIEPQLEVEARGTFREWSVLRDTLSPEIQFSARAGPFASTWRVRQNDTVAPENEAPFGVGKNGKGTVYAAEAALGVHVTSEVVRKRRILREGVIVVGALYETREYSDFLTKREDDGRESPFLGAKGEVLAWFLSIQGFLP
ncbi:MAG: hypothetical protein IOD12_15095 [Silvanigrellales bacterium]|nr:hypothetical protein [Silvanigrellales bacterium]